MRRPRDRSDCDVLVVCTGNACRSAYLAAVLGAAVPDLVTASAGTAARRWAKADEQIRRALTGRGTTIEAHRSRRVHRRVVSQAGVIITATREHRGEIVRRYPAAASKVFTLKELARLVSSPEIAAAHAAPDAAPRDRVAALVARIGGAATAQLDEDADDDLDDPHGLEDAKYAAMITEANAALAAIVPALRPSGH